MQNLQQQGLAQSLVQHVPEPPQPQPNGQQGGQVGEPIPGVREVVQMLMQGKSPEELELMGIPPDVIMQAIQSIEKELDAQNQKQPPAQDTLGGGLASNMVI